MKLPSLLFSTAALLLTGDAVEADVIVFPANGQDKAQQQSDEGACIAWAKNETGIDPMAQQATAPPTAKQESGRGARGAVRGAILGGIVDGSDGAKSGAAIGAVGGRMKQNSRNQASQQQQQQQAQQAQSFNAENKVTFERAYGVCLKGKGYTVG